MTVVERLVNPVDRIRQRLEERLGHRPYKVRLVWTQWSGGERGLGEETIQQVVELSPTPRLSGNVDLSLQASGMEEVGTLEVSEISLDLQEDILTGGLLGVQQSFYWEIDFGQGWQRYIPAGKPEKDISGSFGWRIVLRRCEGCQ